MEIVANQIVAMFTGQTILFVFFKLFALVLSILYTLYAIVFYRQMDTMNKTLQTQTAPVLRFFGLLQIGAALILILLAIVFI